MQRIVQVHNITLQSKQCIQPCTASAEKRQTAYNTRGMHNSYQQILIGNVTRASAINTTADVLIRK